MAEHKKIEKEYNIENQSEKYLFYTFLWFIA